jgi:tartrate-resistant acid phosphatase type 5
MPCQLAVHASACPAPTTYSPPPTPAKMALLLASIIGAAAAPVSSATTFNFLGIGDWGNDSPGQVATAKGMGVIGAQLDAKFVVALGDNFYHSPKSNCKTGSGICNGYPNPDGLDGEKRFQTTFEDMYSAPSLQVPWYAIAGNHDHGGNVSAQIAYGSDGLHHTRWVYPDWYYNVTQVVPVGSGGKTAELEILLFDSVIGLGNSDVYGPDGEVVQELKGHELPGPADPPAAAKQWQWLEARMKASRADYLWVGGHYPVWSIAAHGPTAGLVEKLRPLLHKYEANFFNGHDHDLEHIQEVGSKVNYVTTGSGMACCYPDSHLHQVPNGSVRL